MAQPDSNPEDLRKQLTELRELRAEVDTEIGRTTDYLGDVLPEHTDRHNDLVATRNKLDVRITEIIEKLSSVL